jgi:hypothetical protein
VEEKMKDLDRFGLDRVMSKEPEPLYVDKGEVMLVDPNDRYVFHIHPLALYIVSLTNEPLSESRAQSSGCSTRTRPITSE